MSELDRKYVFLSYAHENIEQVYKLYEGLKTRKVNAWLDKNDLVPGRWKQKIEKAISKSRYFIFCLSESSLKKISDENPTFIDDELQIAWQFAKEQDERSFTIIPVRLEDCGRGDKRLSSWHQYDLFKDWDSVLDTVAVNIGGESLSDTSTPDERTEDEIILEGIMGKAQMWYYSGKYDKALPLLEAAINFKPEDPDIWSTMGDILSDLSRHDEALETYNKAIEIKPDDPDVWAAKGGTLSDL
ncbi:MAG TPA: TIR domain-containing protein, partial [Candidatus Deferrimicrobium sp.]|nr:TIR domain-containing protein [Candidatus Deferrimicrobium sp.]